MGFHKDLRGDDLHPVKVEIVSASPVSSRTPEYIGETIVNTTSGSFFVATGLTDADWVEVGAGGGGGGTSIHNDLTGLNVGDFLHLTAAEYSNLTGSSPEFPTLKVGDVAGGNFIEFDAEGAFRFNGTATKWEDMRVPVTSTTANGSNPPTYSLFATDGAAAPGTTKALSFTSNSAGVGTIPHNAAYNIFTAAHTIEFWFRPTPSSNPFNDIIVKGSAVNISWWGGSDVYVSYGGMGASASNVSLNVGSWNHVLTRFTPGGPNTLEIFVNGTAAGTITSGGAPSNNSNDFIINADTIIFDIDELAVWSKALNNSEIADRYNGGAGEGLIGNEVNLVGLWRFEESSGSTFADSTATANDGSITGTESTHFEWIDGHVGAPNIGSLGVVLPFFSNTTRNELYFTAQLPHGWREGSNIEPHIHWVPPTNGGVGERVTWGLEYSWASVGDVFGNTTILTGSTVGPTDEDLVAYKHYVTDLGTIDATGKTLSSMLVCRVFRDPLDVNDNYGDFATLLEIDFHYEVDSLGSQEEFIKT